MAKAKPVSKPSQNLIDTPVWIRCQISGNAHRHAKAKAALSGKQLFAWCADVIEKAAAL